MSIASSKMLVANTLAENRQLSLGLSAVLMLAVVLLLSGTVAATTRIDVQLDEWTLGFEELEVAAGRIEFRVVNGGRMPHNFRLDWKDARGEAYAVETPLLQPGQEYSLIVTLGSGTYEAWCTVPGHGGLGMAGVVIVTP